MSSHGEYAEMVGAQFQDDMGSIVRSSHLEVMKAMSECVGNSSRFYFSMLQ